ncbi:MAG: DUF1016 family protein, partial [Myxococcales bacterium]|nr:DUF1016 family protein [Myxococcales bacterium]
MWSRPSDTAGRGTCSCCTWSAVCTSARGDEFFPDLLFYHLRLHAYVVVELKAGAFQPEHAGKLNFYLSAVDDLVRDP